MEPSTYNYIELSTYTPIKSSTDNLITPVHTHTEPSTDHTTYLAELELALNSMKRPLRLAIGHQARVGKDTFAAHVTYYTECKTVAIATGVYDIVTFCQKYLDKEVKKDTHMLQFIGFGLREYYGANIWIDSAISKIKAVAQTQPRAAIIVTDMRFPNEMEKLKAEGFTTVKVVRDSRPIDRDPNHPSETALADAEFDYVIDNNGTLAEYIQAIDELLFKLAKE